MSCWGMIACSIHRILHVRPQEDFVMNDTLLILMILKRLHNEMFHYVPFQKFIRLLFKIRAHPQGSYDCEVLWEHLVKQII